MKLLTRDEFRENCLIRDKHSCVICGSTENLSVHHIIERRLFDNGGYFMENGATLCETHHIEAEQTTLSCEEIREAVGITSIVLPSHFYEDERYSKWGDIILGPGKTARRMKGELFEDESVQKILAQGGMLNLYTKYTKFPRTYHLPWSEGLDSDDRMMATVEHLKDKNVIVCVKLDGENTTMYSDYIHARSLDSKSDVTRHWVFNRHAQIKHDIPEGWRISYENLYAKHTIKYENASWLKDKEYGVMFRVWNDKNYCLSWKDTKEWAELIGLPICPILYEGPFDEKIIRGLYQPTFEGDEMEGYVVWSTDSFHYKDYRKYVGKYVTRSFKDRVKNSHGHWRHSALERNV